MRKASELPTTCWRARVAVTADMDEPSGTSTITAAPGGPWLTWPSYQTTPATTTATTTRPAPKTTVRRRRRRVRVRRGDPGGRPRGGRPGPVPVGAAPPSPDSTVTVPPRRSPGVQPGLQQDGGGGL